MQFGRTLVHISMPASTSSGEKRWQKCKQTLGFNVLVVIIFVVMKLFLPNELLLF